MQVVKNIVIGVLLAWLVSLWFMPKQELYYKLEETLAQNDIVMNEKQLDEGIFTLTADKVDLYIKGIKVATIEEISFFTLLFYTKVDIDRVTVDETLGSMLPIQIDNATLSSVAWNPFVVNLFGVGPFGTLEGKADLHAGELRVDFNDSRGIDALKTTLQQDEKGWYYETSF